jgi:geranylgeranyl reductase family protein
LFDFRSVALKRKDSPVSALEEQQFDVAVIGAGPMGSFASERMASQGLRVGLFEKDPRPGDSTVCAGGMHFDVLRFAGLPASVIERVIPKFRLIIGGRVREWRFAKPTYITVDRRELDRFLAERAVRAGVKLVTHAKVVDVAPAEGTVHYEWGAKRERRVARASGIIFADGPFSLSHRVLAGRRRAGPEAKYVGVEYDLDAPGNGFDALEIIPDPKTLPFGYAWIFPKRDHVNVGLARLDSVDGPPLPGLLDRFVAEHLDLRGRAVLRRKGGVIPARLGPVLRKGPCLVIGDAAGMINPFTGGGYVCGFLSASLAAEACVAAFRDGRFSQEKLHRYEQRLRRTRHFRTIQLSAWLLIWMVAFYRRSARPLYLPLMKLYFYAVHVAMKFIPVV